MKKVTLLAVGLFVAVTSALANNKQSDMAISAYENAKHKSQEYIYFVERGVALYVYTDGTFEYDARTVQRYGRRGSVNATLITPNIRVQYSAPSKNNRMHTYGAQIAYDRNGMLTRVGDVWIQYDRYGRITRAGSVSMRYNKFGNLNRVGDLSVHTDRWGRIRNTKGRV